MGRVRLGSATVTFVSYTPTYHTGQNILARAMTIHQIPLGTRSVVCGARARHTQHEPEVDMEPISDELVAVLACPQCGGKVVLEENDVRCVRSDCGLLYPVKDGIPVMLIEEALPDDLAPGKG